MYFKVCIKLKAFIILVIFLLAGFAQAQSSGSKQAYLENAYVTFHTNDEDKDGDTHVTITIRDSSNVRAARLSNDLGHFDDHGDFGPYSLEVTNPCTKESLQRGRIKIRIDPNGHDTWRFNFDVELMFSDGTIFTGGEEGLELDQDRREQSFGLKGMIHEET